jgi:electron transfer flavoprotein beta subunit
MMAIGVDRAVHLVSDGQEWDPQGTAAAIAEAIRAQPEPYDLLLFGNESADAANYQVAIRVAYALGLPCVTGVKAITVGDGRVRAEQEVQSGREVYEVPLPVVATVKEGLNLPRYPSVPGRLRAKRKPVEALKPERPEPRLEMVRLVHPPGSGKQVRVLGHGADAAPAVVEVLSDLGLLARAPEAGSVAR